MNALRCPRCQQPLSAAQHHHDLLLACGGCGGVWLQPSAAQRLLGPLPDLGVPAASKPPLPCPACHNPMTALYSPRAGVEIDRCEQHGVWFDRGEMGHVAAAIARMQGKPPPQVPGPGTALAAGTVAAAAGATGAVVGGVAVAGAAAALAAAEALGADSAPSRSGVSIGDAVEVAGEAVVHAPNLADAGVAATEVASDLAEPALEVGGTVLESAGDVLGSILGALGDIFS